MRLERVSRAYLLGLPELPGLSPDESTLVLEFARWHCYPHDRFSIGVPIGPGDTTAPSFGAAIDRMWARITRRKIDAVIWRERYTLIVEAKVHARMPAVTQLLRYVELFRGDYPHARLVIPSLVCRSCDLGVPQRLAQADASLVLMPLRGWPMEAQA